MGVTGTKIGIFGGNGNSTVMPNLIGHLSRYCPAWSRTRLLKNRLAEHSACKRGQLSGENSHFPLRVYSQKHTKRGFCVNVAKGRGRCKPPAGASALLRHDGFQPVRVGGKALDAELAQLVPQAGLTSAQTDGVIPAGTAPSRLLPCR